jgi:hypothetical protein
MLSGANRRFDLSSLAANRNIEIEADKTKNKAVSAP